jgi:nucleotide-binding universal stress UspA family protein
MDKILVGYDDTEASRRALERAVQFAQVFGARLHVVSIVPVTAGTDGGTVISPAQGREYARQLEDARALVAGIEPGLDAPVDYRTAVGDPAGTLVELGDALGVDLIVVGSRDPAALARLFGGSVSATVVRHTRRDVLVVHQKPPEAAPEGLDGPS